MSETPLFDYSKQPDPIDEAINLANSAARTIVDQEPPRPAQPDIDPRQTALPIETEEKKKANYVARRVGAALAGAALIVGGGKIATEAIDYLDGHESSETKIEVTIPHGGTAWDALNEVEGIGGVNKNDVLQEASTYPENIDISFGNLKPGDTITLPEKVEP